MVPLSKQECEDLLDAMSRMKCEKPGSFCTQSHLVFPSANSAEISPGRTVFISYILRIICTLGARALFFLYMFKLRLHDASGSFRITERYGRDTYRQWGEHYAERIPTGPLPSAPFSVYIRIPLNFVITAVFFSIPWSYLEHIKAASQYHGRLSTVQDIWDQYTSRIVKEYQDFLLVVRLAHLSSSFFRVDTNSKRLLCSCREYLMRGPRSTFIEARLLS